MSDLISRADLFNRLATVQTLGEAYGVIQGMPTRKKHVEMIIDYVTDGDDYQYSDNRGVLTRCKDCKYYDAAEHSEENDWCHAWASTTTEDGYCNHAERVTG